MKSSTHVLLLALLLCVALTSRISSVWAKPQGGNSQNRVVGEVVKTDQTTKRLTIKTATGEIEVVAGDTAVLLRVPPGEASADKASKISFGGIEIGDRAFALVGAAEEGKPLQATQVVVTSRSASERQDRSQEFRARGIAGRITEINPQTKHTNLGTPIGNLTSPLFGQSNTTAGGFGFGGGNQAAGNRRVEIQLRFAF